MDELIFNTRHSLIDQSLSAQSSEQTTNGDGFGIGWYGRRATPGVYKNIQPAWNDANLQNLCNHIESSLFLAHVRAATSTSIQHTNCHPFRHGKWLFVHNGVVREFARVRRAMAIELEDQYFREMAGSTDTELMFLLALQFGLADDVYGGVARMVGFIEKVGCEAGIQYPMQMTLGIADGERLYAFRYSTEGDSRSLFHSKDIDAIRNEMEPSRHSMLDQMTDAARCIVSEPLSELADLWQPIPESSFVTIEDGKVECRPFQPETP